VANKYPLCAVGILAHSIGLVLSLGNVGYSFYPVSVWWYMLFLTALYSYKSSRELCRECITSFLASFGVCLMSVVILDYVPWNVILTYILVLIISLCITAQTT
jgi:hypothetical protein